MLFNIGNKIKMLNVSNKIQKLCNSPWSLTQYPSFKSIIR